MPWARTRNTFQEHWGKSRLRSHKRSRKDEKDSQRQGLREGRSRGPTTHSLFLFLAPLASIALSEVSS